MRRSIRLITIIVLSIAIAALLGFNALMIWVATGPRSLDDISPYIETALTSEDHYSIDIGQTWLVWDGWKHPIDIRLRDVSVQTKDGQEFSNFSEVSLGLHIFSLMKGQVLPTSLTIDSPIISLLQNPDHTISFGIKAPVKASQEGGQEPSEEVEKSVPFGAVLMPLLMPDSDSNFRKLHSISIKHADVTVGSSTKGVFFNAHDAGMIFRRTEEGLIRAETHTKINYDKYTTPIDANLTLTEKEIVANLSFTELMPGILSDLFSNNPHLKLLHLPMNGKARLRMDLEGHLKDTSFKVDAGQGTLNSVYLDSVLDVKKMHAEGKITNELHDIQIDTFSANIDGSNIKASGTVMLKNEDAAIHANASIDNVKAEDIHKFWPPELAPLTRKWVTTNITKGNVPKASTSVNIAFGDLAKPALPKESVDATIELTDAVIRYLPEHPPVKNLKATIHVDGIALDAKIASADYMDITKLSDGRVYIADLNPQNPYLNIDLRASSNATDMVRFLDLPRLSKAQPLNLDIKTAKGNVTGKAKLGFHFYAPVDKNGKPLESDITYNIEAELNNMSQPNFMNKFDLNGIYGKLTIDNAALEFSGTGDVNGAQVAESKVTYYFEERDGDDSEYDTFIQVKAAAPVSSLPRFGYPAFEFLSGTLGVNANVKQGRNIESASAQINLIDAAVKTDVIPWQKTIGEPAQFKIMTRKEGSKLSIPAIHLKSYLVDARGSLALNDDLSAIKNVSLNKLKLGETNLDIFTYTKTDNGYNIIAKGLVADVSSWVDDPPEDEQPHKPADFSFAHFPELSLKADILRVITRKDHILHEVTADIDCNVAYCKFADVKGNTADNKPFSFRILHNPKHVRQLSINADNAGALMGALNLLDGVDGGLLTITGEYNDTKEASLLFGNARISEHTVRGVPILGKLLSLASFTGIIDALQGNGITFDRMRTGFTLTNDVLTFVDGKTFGSSMGLTADGTITFPKRSLNIEGTIVPSYTLNNVLGKVPLVGPLLMGDDDTGIFAARYSITGTSEEPEVSVNPLSFLTPGFLRGLFDILDTPDKTQAEAAAIIKENTDSDTTADQGIDVPTKAMPMTDDTAVEDAGTKPASQ